MDDLLVVGMDLVTGRVVHVGDASADTWKIKGFGGDGTLVCRDCLDGDGVPAGTKVPLVYRGRLHGKRRAHFAHPPGLGPKGGHWPETAWHRDAKKAIASWACWQPGFVSVCLERWTPDRRRRSDVRVTLREGPVIAIEVQQHAMTDSAWRKRHRDYASEGILDIWLWHQRVGVPGIALGEPQCHWQLNEQLDRIGMPIAHAHIGDAGNAAAPGLWLGEHYPPCSGDRVRFAWQDLSDLTLSGRRGLVLVEHADGLWPGMPSGS
ncbi:hypothetical protein Rhe02_56100 [Rhizocola hellebori]|uniref:Competence protein CoiA nuclease-like domain-containing protein n=1 Tax=Rhizocola hellebori TaxID=1392758 RepID=A0A8J3VJ18_9ACTN|nr:competence protein CoiA family protein [Rhizocola hellebori]GIH07543.1 hypothetical protein Rhe02_56100 [Rhizocola hellebori]